MKIVLTGANGQVGQEIQTELPKELVATLIPLSHQSCDITSSVSVEDMYRFHQPDLILNAAAYTAVDRAEEEPEKAYAVNAEGVKHLVNICQKFNIPLIHLSTDYVFDGRKNTSYHEEDVAGPLNIYGKTKLAGEELIIQSMKEYIILRTSWVFSEHGNNFVKTILRLATEKKELRIVHDQMGCPTAAKNIAKTIWEIVKKIQYSRDNIPWGIYHYSDLPAVSWYEFSKKITSHISNSQLVNIIPITTDEYPTQSIRPKNSIMDCSKIVKTFHIEQNKWEPALISLLSE